MLKSRVNTKKIAAGFTSLLMYLISLILASIYCRTVVFNDLPGGPAILRMSIRLDP